MLYNAGGSEERTAVQRPGRVFSPSKTDANYYCQGTLNTGEHPCSVIYRNYCALHDHRRLKKIREKDGQLNI
jgi:hypothetical protein